jgi:hypothetical protein
MANYKITMITNPGVPGAQGAMITWTGEGAPKPGMQVKISNNDASGQNWYGSWVENSPLTPPWTGWRGMNPAGVVAQSLTTPINLANGPVYVFPTYGTQVGVSGVWSTYPVVTPSADGTSAVASGQLSGSVSNITIQVIGGGGDPV